MKYFIINLNLIITKKYELNKYTKKQKFKKNYTNINIFFSNFYRILKFIFYSNIKTLPISQNPAEMKNKIKHYKRDVSCYIA